MIVTAGVWLIAYTVTVYERSHLELLRENGRLAEKTNNWQKDDLRAAAHVVAFSFAASSLGKKSSIPPPL